ncbi:putative peptide modification system cyclase [Lysobacter solisilvae (ex Woo and Kim 2020)]|uniref:Putative peptide modification system cyclase n=1 Tax=Agrilutibacter terrestris TaxID=2865112 RepID=A0A7H0G0P3_9GAMM|nr:putative peptide modification system cyclase [Lysobacter terrestris]QNP41859.1 putative peptide modification system cyclase [Lysobacter terrestris]
MDTAVQTFDPTPEPAPRPAANAPQLRTLLLTDLVDSTTLVERLGDTPASELFRAHDRLVLQLQQQWHGRLIDRSDGLLLLFERPIDGLGFALDYVRGLAALGEERGLLLRARAGLHVGEVLTWRNSDEAVRIGAKPLEVEGLAKPIAARLMAMARPGQILLSAVAEPLAHRAARELGERGQHLAWKSWGRWRFKGVPEPQQVFEVGEPGIAPLRVPPNTPKAWRDIPLWRRPAALAAEVALLVGGALGVWFLAAPEPAIAFNQRDWVVVGDLRNLTGQGALDDSLEQAFRISLEQSRYVNVLSDLKARDTLQRMQRPEGTVLDRAVASEIALRDGARAVILPTVAEVGGRVRVSAEVIDPRTQTTVYSQSADGDGAASTLESIDEVTAALREKLGEALASIEKDSVPLPQVATKNLDALRAYALGQKAYAQVQFKEALGFYRQATALDPQFALAWLGQTRAQASAVNAEAALDPLGKAQALRDHLAPREALYLDAWAADLLEPAQALTKWKELASLYPDYWPAQANASMHLMAQNRFRDALLLAQRSTSPYNELAALSYDTIGRVKLGLDDYRGAGTAFETALARGVGSSLRRAAATEAAQRNFARADQMLAKAAKDDLYSYFDRVSIGLDRGQWQGATAQAAIAMTLASREEGGFPARLFRLPAAVADWSAGDADKALQGSRATVAAALDALSQPIDANAADDAALGLMASIFALRLGDREPAERVLAMLQAKPVLLGAPTVAELTQVARAEMLGTAGKPKEAIRLLEPLLTGHEQYQTRVSLMRAYAAAGENQRAVEQSLWLQRHRGLAYMELGCAQCQQALNVVEGNLSMLRAAELLKSAGHEVESRRQLARFDAVWPPQSLPDYLRVRRGSLLSPASN